MADHTPSRKVDEAHLDKHAGGHPTLAHYLGVFAALMVLLIITLVAATWEMGQANIWIAMIIAVIKAALVMAIFMHLMYSTRLVRLFATVALLFLAILFALTLSDYVARVWLPDRGY
jgi:cytochrome c oxidase subunit 4